MPKTKKPSNTNTDGASRSEHSSTSTNPSFSTNDQSVVGANESGEMPTLKAFDRSGYDKGRKLGNGAFGEVVQMDAKDGSAPLAMKTATSVAGREDLENEAHILEQLGEHKNIVGYGGFDKQDGGGSGLALEFLGGGDLQEMQDQLHSAYKNRKIGHEQYWGAMQHLLKGTTAGIGHMADTNMVHGDLKFGNVGLNSETLDAKVLDFGTTRDVGEKHHGAMTPAVNASPELFGNGDRGLSATHDMYAIGQMAHQAKDNQFHASGPGYQTYMKRKEEADKAERGEWDAFSGPTAHDAFLKGTLQPDANERMTADDALESKFLSDPALQEDSAKDVLRMMLDDRQNLAKDKKKGYEGVYGKPKTESELVQENKDGRDQRLADAKVQNKADKLSKKKALAVAQQDFGGPKKRDQKKAKKQQSSLMKELRKATKDRKNGTGNGGLKHVEPNSGGAMARLSEDERARMLHPESHWSLDKDGEEQRAHRSHTGKSKKAKKGEMEGWWSNH